MRLTSNNASSALAFLPPPFVVRGPTAKRQAKTAVLCRYPENENLVRKILGRGMRALDFMCNEGKSGLGAMGFLREL